jgi:hypothetical protein
MGAVVALYLPHLAEEALTGMYDDPVIVRALSPLASLSARHSTYLVFQVTFALALAIGFVATLGERARLLVLGGMGVALLCEGHHVVRACVSLQTNPGLLTSLPMPILGALLLHRVTRDWHASSHTLAL